MLSFVFFCLVIGCFLVGVSWLGFFVCVFLIIGVYVLVVVLIFVFGCCGDNLLGCLVCVFELLICCDFFL